MRRPTDVVGRYAHPSLDASMIAAIRAMLEPPDDYEDECEQLVERIMALVRNG